MEIHSPSAFFHQEVVMKRNTCWISGIFLSLTLFAADSNALTISEDTVWATGTGPYTQTQLFISEATLTIEPNVVVKFNKDGFLRVREGGRITATGAMFTWANEGDEWNGIQFVEGDSRSRLKNCIIEHVFGYPTTGARAMVHIGGSTPRKYPSPAIVGCTIGNGSALRAIQVNNSCPQILDNTISGFLGYGIRVDGESAPLVAGNLITGNNRGIGVFSGGAGLYRANVIQGNTDYGFYNGNSGSSPNINARYNWWGDGSGPKPSGMGDLISSKVDYSPWAGSIVDSDGDGMWDEWEIQQFTDTAKADEISDNDDDGFLDKGEFLGGTDPNDKDTDGDGVWDGLEVQAGMNPTRSGDYDFDGDEDDFSNLRELISGTDPWNAASFPAIFADGDPEPSGDADVDGKDLAGLIAELGSVGCPGCTYDLDADGDVDVADLFLFSEDFGRTTP
jgi:hypothetical protein